MSDFLLYWLCALFLMLPSPLILPVLFALAVGTFAAGVWVGSIRHNL